MKGILTIIFLSLALILIFPLTDWAQCSICAKTAQQMGEKPAQGMNSGIIYLMLAPFLLIAFIGYRWWKSNGS